MVGEYIRITRWVRKEMGIQNGTILRVCNGGKVEQDYMVKRMDPNIKDGMVDLILELVE